MTHETIKPRNPFADIAPTLADYTDNVLFGDMWKRPQLSPREPGARLRARVQKSGAARHRLRPAQQRSHRIDGPTTGPGA